VRPSRRPLIIATRRSALALAQANAVARVLAGLNPDIQVDLLPLSSAGDQPDAEAPVDTGEIPPVGGKGRFTRNIEAAVLDGRADLAVHSLKDLPVHDTPGLIVAAFPRRGDARDCLISRHPGDLAALPEGAVVGTGSLRRAAQLTRLRPDLRIVPIRGNVETRLSKVLHPRSTGADAAESLDATLLAVAGLQRNGMAEHANRPLPPELMLPAPGQGALAVQCRADDHVTLRRLLPLNDADTAACVSAERQVAAALAADCHSPLGVLAELDERKHLHLRARVLTADGGQCVSAGWRMPAAAARRLVRELTQQLLNEGAHDLLHGERSASDRR